MCARWNPPSPRWTIPGVTAAGSKRGPCTGGRNPPSAARFRLTGSTAFPPGLRFQAGRLAAVCGTSAGAASRAILRARAMQRTRRPTRPACSRTGHLSPVVARPPSQSPGTAFLNDPVPQVHGGARPSRTRVRGLHGTHFWGRLVPDGPPARHGPLPAAYSTTTRTCREAACCNSKRTWKRCCPGRIVHRNGWSGGATAAGSPSTSQTICSTGGTTEA